MTSTKVLDWGQPEFKAAWFMVGGRQVFPFPQGYRCDEGSTNGGKHVTGSPSGGDVAVG